MQICYPSNLVPSIVGCGGSTSALLFYNSHGPIKLKLGFALASGALTSSMCVILGLSNGRVKLQCTEVEIFGGSGDLAKTDEL